MPRKQENIENAITVTKQRRKSVEKFGEENIEPGDNARYLRQARVALSLPPIDISDEKQVWDRIMAYFDHCEQFDRKPQMIGMANWLGIDRSTLNSWKRGECRSGNDIRCR